MRTAPAGATGTGTRITIAGPSTAAGTIARTAKTASRRRHAMSSVRAGATVRPTTTRIRPAHRLRRTISTRPARPHRPSPRHLRDPSTARISTAPGTRRNRAALRARIIPPDSACQAEASGATRPVRHRHRVRSGPTAPPTPRGRSPLITRPPRAPSRARNPAPTTARARTSTTAVAGPASRKDIANNREDDFAAGRGRWILRCAQNDPFAKYTPFPVILNAVKDPAGAPRRQSVRFKPAAGEGRGAL